MNDIVERIKDAACPANTGCMSIKTCVCDVMGEAADCIEELREQLDHERYVLKETQEGWELLHTQNKRLRERITELDGFIKTIEEQATVLEKENVLLNKEIMQATLFLNNMNDEMADARREIKDMNGRISRLRVEAGYD
jgi:chromosome segregation ATPase